MKLYNAIKIELSVNGITYAAITALSALLLYMVTNFNEICAAITVLFRL
jgi:hypothetical protein